MPFTLQIQRENRELVTEEYPTGAKVLTRHFQADPTPIPGVRYDLPPGTGNNQVLEQVGIDAIHPHLTEPHNLAISLMPHTRPAEVLINNIPHSVSPDDDQIILKPNTTLKLSTPKNASPQACMVLEYRL